MASKRGSRFGKKTEASRTHNSVDPVTGVPSRSVVAAALGAALDDGREVALMAISIDRFTEVNERLGRDIGDDALKRFATHLNSEAPDTALVGRLGGDEFCIALFDSREAAAQLREIVNAASELPITEAIFDLELSAGIVVAGGSETPIDLFQHADVAMHTAKAQVGTTTIEFDRVMHMQWGRDRIRREELTAAIEKGQIELYFQPEFDLRTDVVVGAEALLRWNHPSLGLIAAGDFVEDLERFELLPKLVSLLFEQAEHLANNMATQNDTFTMRLNVSPEQLLDPTFPSFLERAVDSTSVNWCLEVTERTMATATPKLRSIFEQLRKLGAEIALDDFGTGYSSVYELQALPVDAIKLDPVFVRALDAVDDPSTSIAAVLLDLARAVDIHAVAEGVESEEQRRALIELGCYRAQGYLFGQPLSASEFLTNWSPYKVLATV